MALCGCGHEADRHGPTGDFAHGGSCADCNCERWHSAEVGRKRLVKLVRSRIGQFLGGDSKVTYEPLSEGDGSTSYRFLLEAKLVEEAFELIHAHAPDIRLGEMGDIYEALEALARLDGHGIHEVATEADRKREERGGFWPPVGMFVTTTAPPRHEGEHGG